VRGYLRSVGSVASYAVDHSDPIRRRFEEPLFGRLICKLLRRAGGGRMLDVGCGDGLAARLAGASAAEYVGLDFRPVAVTEGEFVLHDLRDGLGPVGTAPFDLYFGGFGILSHLDPPALGRLLGDVARHGRPGSVVALEALGLHSLEWPRAWDSAPGGERLLPYRLGGELVVHPWAAPELAAAFALAGIEWLGCRDRTLQAGPKVGDSRYWPGVPKLRDALATLAQGDSDGIDVLGEPLPPLPAHPAAIFHHTLAANRHKLLSASTLEPDALARRIWELEPRTASGFGHGLIAIGRVR